jgi:hypothetical protein
MELTNLIVLVFIGLASAGLFVLTSRVKRGNKVTLRPQTGYIALHKQVGRAVESGQPLHISLGRGNLAGPASPTSVAALTMLTHLAEGSCASGMPPTVTTGDGSLMITAQDRLRRAFQQAHRSQEFNLALVQNQSGDTFPLAYAAGANQLLHQQPIGSNILAGRFGSEIAFMTEAGERIQAEQIVSSDDPVALAVAYPVSDELIIGEEHLAAGAYLQNQPTQQASVQLQDILRLLVILAIILAAFVGFISNLVN